MNFDIIIAGAGPAGCTFACGLRDAGLNVALIEPKSREDLGSPPFDGREIALSQRTVDILADFGIWQLIPEDEVSFIHASKVINGRDAGALGFDRAPFSAGPLGRLVSNHVIQKAAFTAAVEMPGITLIDRRKVAAMVPGTNDCSVMLDDGQHLTAPLVVAADTRFSTLRRQAGIAASMHDFGQTMLVCRMAHARPHHSTAWECFLYGATIAVLPLKPGVSSIVLTLPQHQMSKWQDMTPKCFQTGIEELLSGQFGPMKLASERIAYPLVGVYADRFVADGFALVGDAAVGMHPVTAHGYNFCVTGAEALARRVTSAARNGRDFRARRLLLAYEAEHRLRTRPLYEATQKLVQLYTAETAVTKLARKLVLEAGKRFPPARIAITSMLSRPAA